MTDKVYCEECRYARPGVYMCSMECHNPIFTERMESAVRRYKMQYPRAGAANHDNNGEGFKPNGRYWLRWLLGRLE